MCVILSRRAVAEVLEVPDCEYMLTMLEKGNPVIVRDSAVLKISRIKSRTEESFQGFKARVRFKIKIF